MLLKAIHIHVLSEFIFSAAEAHEKLNKHFISTDEMMLRLFLTSSEERAKQEAQRVILLFLQRRFFGSIRGAEMSAGNTREHTELFSVLHYSLIRYRNRRNVSLARAEAKEKMLLNNFSSTPKDFVTVFLLHQPKTS